MSNVRLPDGRLRLTFSKPLLLSWNMYVKSCTAIDGGEAPCFALTADILDSKYILQPYALLFSLAYPLQSANRYYQHFNNRCSYGDAHQALSDV